MSDDSGGKHSFWTSLPGLLTAVAALITALVGAGALIIAVNDSDDDSDATTTSGSTQEPSGPSTTSPQPRSSSSSGGSDETPEDGSALLQTSDFLDVDQGLSGGAVDGELNWSGSQLNLYGPRSAIVDEPLDLAGCEAVLTTRSDSVLYGPPLQGGTSYVCMTTREGAIALVTVTPPDVRSDLAVSWTLWP